jgi:hypothetical protein
VSPDFDFFLDRIGEGGTHYGKVHRAKSIGQRAEEKSKIKNQNAK